MPQNYEFLFKSSLQHYTAERFIVRCFDDRFRAVFEAFIQSRGFTHFDSESVAGGVKIFASPESATDRDYMLRELEKSRLLHKTEKVMLFSHHDCGAYGGIAKFDNNRDREFAFHTEEHKKAQQIIFEKFPNVQIESYFIDENGIIKIG